MRYSLVITACAILVTCAFFAGCTSPSQAEIRPAGTETPAPAPVTAATPVPTSTTFTEPVLTLPVTQFVDLQLSKDRPTSKIHLLYNGGPGEVTVQTIRMRVTRPDVTVSDQLMDNGQKPVRGDELVLPGSRGSDRAEVWVTSAGTVYKVMDQQLLSPQ